MYKYIFCYFLLSIYFSFDVFGQQTHDVERGETLYSVSKKYTVTISDLIKANPKAKRGLREGMSIVIPIIHDSIDTVVYILHKVRPLESFYSIKNKYGIEQKELIDFNPQLEYGFRAGTFIKIPQHDEIDVTEKLELKEQDAEVNFIEELKNKELKFKKKESYNIAFMLPLYLDKNDTIESYQNTNEENDIYKKSHYALEFYSGAKIAIDALKKLGISLNIYIFDTENNPNNTFDLVAKKEFDNMDLVIGPFYSNNFKIAAEILSRRDVPIIAPLSSKGNLLENISNAFQVIPTKKRQLTYLSKYIAKHHSNGNIIVVRRNNSEEEQYLKWMSSALEMDSLASFNEIVVDNAVIDSIHHELDSMTEKNVILIPSIEKDFVTDVLTKLNATRDSSIIIYGMPEWTSFEKLDYDYLMNLNVHVPNSGLINYEDSLTKYFIDHYQLENKSAPSERFAFSGFDVTYYFASILHKEGGLSSNMYLEPINLSSINFDYNYPRNRKNGSRNQSVQIIKYENLEIIRVDE